MLFIPEWPSNYQDQFWEAYPRRIAKKDALKVLTKISRTREVPFEVLISAVRNYAQAVKGKEMQFIAHPATWLNKGRWDDDPKALQSTKPLPNPSQQPLNGHVVTIHRETPQAAAWEKHRGKPIPWGKTGTWCVPSEYPPGHCINGTAILPLNGIGHP